MIEQELNQNWRVCLASGQVDYHRPQTQSMAWIPAQVPGSIHTDLMAAGVIPDPHSMRHEVGCAWVDDAEWLYECEFDWLPKAGHPWRILCFEGLDTVCDVVLNGTKIGSFDNMFLAHEVDVSNVLVEGRNTLQIRFSSAVKVGDARRHEYFRENGIPTGTAWFDERAFVRKAGCMSGWDWGPRLVSCGIWKPIRLVEFQSRIKSVTCHQEHISGDRFRLSVSTVVDGPGEPSIMWNGHPVGFEFESESERWCPNGEGQQVLNTLSVSLGNQIVEQQIGLRTIQLSRKPDEFGTCFEFIVNGRRLWCRGANWIPHDSFFGRVSRSDVFDAVERYRKLGFNMLRVWGGGVYESTDFYDACDMAGILVWQDFPYACSYYPDDEAWQQVAYEEAVNQINRLKGRTCLALWCGNNENRALWAGKWGGADSAPSRFFGEVLFDKILKRACDNHDPGRAYIESSPLLVQGLADSAHTPAPCHSDDHYWDVWHGRGDWVHYPDSAARFSSEFGFASSCSLHAWEKVAAGLTDLDDPLVRWHDKTGKPWPEFRGLVETHYPHAKTLEEWVYTSQLNQRDAMRAALEHYRTNPACSGALIWQANDIWPAQSWSLEDHCRLMKPAGFEMERCFAPMLVTGSLKDGRLVSTVCNDSPGRISGNLDVKWLGPAGEPICTVSAQVDVNEGERSSYCFEPACGSAFALIAANGFNAQPRLVSLHEPKDLQLVPQDLAAARNGESVSLTCPGFVLDLVVWNEGDAFRLVDCQSGIAGCRAWSGHNMLIDFAASGDLKLAARSAAGRHRIVWQ